jgi:hypothetical protein
MDGENQTSEQATRRPECCTNRQREDVLEKRRLDQALNAKEFAVCAGVSYSTARGWFHLRGFPVFHGVIFWQDFVQWRMAQKGLENAEKKFLTVETETPPDASLPLRAAKILRAV